MHNYLGLAEDHSPYFVKYWIFVGFVCFLLPSSDQCCLFLMLPTLRAWHCVISFLLQVVAGL